MNIVTRPVAVTAPVARQTDISLGPQKIESMNSLSVPIIFNSDGAAAALVVRVLLNGTGTPAVQIVSDVTVPGYSLVSQVSENHAEMLFYSTSGSEIPMGRTTLGRMVFPTDETSDRPRSVQIVYAEVADRNAHMVAVRSNASSVDLAALPGHFSLGQNSPNPFNPVTRISYDVAFPTHVRIAVYNLLGQEVRLLVDWHHEAGPYSAVWDGINAEGHAVSTGMYVYRMSTESGYQSNSRMLLLK